MFSNDVTHCLDLQLPIFTYFPDCTDVPSVDLNTVLIYQWPTKTYWPTVYRFVPLRTHFLRVEVQPTTVPSLSRRLEENTTTVLHGNVIT